MSFDDAYKAARAAQQQPPPAPSAALQQDWSALARRVDDEIMARFLRSKRTRQARRCRRYGSRGDKPQWAMGAFEAQLNLSDDLAHAFLTYLGSGVRITQDGDWVVIINAGRVYNSPTNGVTLLKRLGMVSGRHEGSPELPVDGVYETVQGIVASFMVKNNIPLS